MGVLDKAKNGLPSTNGRRFFRVFPWVWLVAAYGLTMLVLCLHGRAYLDSDMSSEMVLADLLNQEGGVMSTNWWYSTEIKVCSLQMFYQIGLRIFPHDWYAARMVGQGLLVLVLLLSYLYVGHGLKLRGNGVWGAAALACPFGVWYLWYGFFGGYYVAYMIFVLLSFGAILHLMDPAPRWRRALQWILLIGSAGISGLNSVKGMMVFYLPMVAASLLVVWIRWHARPQQFPRREGKLLLLSVLAFALAAAGYLVNSTVLAATHAFENFNGQSWSAFSFEKMAEGWSLFLSLFGYPGDAFFDGVIPLLSLRGILGAFGFLTLCAILVSLFRLLQRCGKLQDVQTVVPILLACICVIQGLILSCTGTSGAEPKPMNASYWLPAVPFVFPVLQLEGETEDFRLPFARRAAALAFCLCFVATSISATQQFFAQNYRGNPHLEEVTDWVAQQGYTQGYATFWNANVVTEWSSGQLEMWCVRDFNTMITSPRLQKISHQTPPQGALFLLTTQAELEKMGLTNLYWWSDVVYEDSKEEYQPEQRYLVMAYDSFDDMMTAVQGAQSWNDTDGG